MMSVHGSRDRIFVGICLLWSCFFFFFVNAAIRRTFAVSRGRHQNVSAIRNSARRAHRNFSCVSPNKRKSIVLHTSSFLDLDSRGSFVNRVLFLQNCMGTSFNAIPCEIPCEVLALNGPRRMARSLACFMRGRAYSFVKITPTCSFLSLLETYFY